MNEWPGKTRAMGDFLLLKQIILGEADMSLWDIRLMLRFCLFVERP